MSDSANLDRLPIVLDCGSFQTKVGFAGEGAPRSVFRTVVGKPKHECFDSKSVYVGEEAVSKRGILRMCNAIERGSVTNWDAIEEVWKYSIEEELKVTDVSEQSLMLTWSGVDSASIHEKEKAAEIMFERVDVSALYVESPSILSLYSFGKTTGCVVDSGHGLTNIVPVFEGFRMPQANKRVSFGGMDVTTYLAKLLMYKGHSLTNTAETEIVRGMKEQLAYVALDPASERPEETIYELPDGTSVLLDEERFRCAEALLQPRLALPEDWETPGLPQLIHDSITQCDIDVRRALWSNLVLSGGNTLFPGLPARLTQELTALAPGHASVQVIDSPHTERQYAAWVGGSIVASMSGAQQKWASKIEYQESGGAIAHRKGW